MNNIEYKIIPITDESIIHLESIRYNAYNINETKVKYSQSFYAKELKNKKYLVFGCFLNNKLVGACYVSNAHNSLYIEQLFISKKYQNSNLHLGTNLLKFVLKNKNTIEDYFKTKFYISYLDSYKKTTEFYKKIGYKEKDFYMRKFL